ncbi:transposase [Pleurocapsa sp. PCC 7327]|uniref:transposase n=1 Tax=Pleurocapsa sp. PCC 7327 TaxID=118163 RepID=UPI0020C808E7|nr:transposase [Pleurocapsa sp. PCC 7327]
MSTSINCLIAKISPSIPGYSQDCSSCGARVKKSLSTRTHVCSCGAVLCRDWNAAINILNKGLEQLGWGTPKVNPSGQINLCLVGENSHE